MYFRFFEIKVERLKFQQSSPKDGYIPRRCFFRKKMFFSEPDWYVEPDQNCTLPLVKNGKIGNTNCLIGNLNMIGYMHVVSMRTTFVPSKIVIHQCILKL